MMRECELNVHLRLNVKAAVIDQNNQDSEIFKAAQKQIEKSLPDARLVDIRVVRVLTKEK